MRYPSGDTHEYLPPITITCDTTIQLHELPQWRYTGVPTTDYNYMWYHNTITWDTTGEIHRSTYHRLQLHVIPHYNYMRYHSGDTQEYLLPIIIKMIPHLNHSYIHYSVTIIIIRPIHTHSITIVNRYPRRTLKFTSTIHKHTDDRLERNCIQKKGPTASAALLIIYLSQCVNTSPTSWPLRERPGDRPAGDSTNAIIGHMI